MSGPAARHGPAPHGPAPRHWGRREVLGAGLAVSGATALGALAAATPGGKASAAERAFGRLPDGTEIVGVTSPPAVYGGHYVGSREPLRPTALLRLPPGSVTPGGWLAHQIELQLNGLCGRYPEVSDFLRYSECGWVDSTKDAWEELPYWLRGYGELAYITGNQTVYDTTEKWINGILATQKSDGWFGPAGLRTSLEGGPDLWPGMPLLATLRSWHEHTGDDRIPAFLSRYFSFQSTQDPAVFGRSWGSFRWGDTLDSIYWLFNRSGESRLLDLARTIHANSADYVNGIPSPHNVNFTQGFREPLQYGLLDGSEHLSMATYRLYGSIMGTYGQFAGGGFAGDENYRPGFVDPRQGFETCGIVEFMHSFELLTRLTGDRAWADRCEELAFNSLPAAFDTEQQAVHYITCANSIQLDNGLKTRGQFQNDFPMLAYQPGVHNYRCCPHNYGMGWPYFIEELWSATTDNGLCAVMYAESEVRAKVGSNGNSGEVILRQHTEYPFSDTIDIVVSTASSVAFPLYLRIPGWCTQPRLHINGTAVEIPGGEHHYLRISRTWLAGDRIRLQLPMATTIRTWERNHGSVSVDRGPLTYSLRIGEDARRTGGTQQWPEIEVFPTSTWNYGLELEGGFQVSHREGPLAKNPFTQHTAPIELRATGRKIPGWQADPEHVVHPLQASPALSNEPTETLALIPMAAARLRITSFPVIGQGEDAHEWVVPPEVSASHRNEIDSLHALSDTVVPASSKDDTIPRFTWWDHLGTEEWVQYDFPAAMALSATAVYWYDDGDAGACRVPESWRLLYLDAGQWLEVSGPGGDSPGGDSPGGDPIEYGIAPDRFNEVRFAEVHTTAIRLVARLRPDFSTGILEWRAPRRTLGSPSG